MPKKKAPKKLSISQAQELKILRKVVEITNSELHLDLTLKEVVIIVNDMTKADSVFIYLYEDKKKSLVLAASKTPHKKELGTVVLAAGEGVAGWVVKENKPVAIKSGAYKDERFKNFDDLPEDKFEALLSVPITDKNMPIGVINIQHKKAHEYSEGTIELISLITKQVSGVIKNARLFEETNQKALQFDSLHKVSKSIISKEYLDEILNLIVVVTAEMLNSKICSVMLLDQKGRELKMMATQSMSEAYKKKPNLKVSTSISGDVIKTKKPVSVYDVQKEVRYNFRDLAKKENLTSMLAVPMIVKDHAVGVISVYTKEPHQFSDEEINVLQMVANQAAVAVENTNLVEETVKAKEALETRKIVERAKGIIMKHKSLTEDQAHKMIHKKAMDSCKSMKEVAESIILMDEL